LKPFVKCSCNASRIASDGNLVESHPIPKRYSDGRYLCIKLLRPLFSTLDINVFALARRTGSSELTFTSYSFSPAWSRGGGADLPFRGLDIPSTKPGDDKGVFTFRAMTLGTKTGWTAEALPMRMFRDPGWITITFEPRLRYLSGLSRTEAWMVDSSYLCSAGGSTVTSSV
jgi:hypothetical protein